MPPYHKAPNSGAGATRNRSSWMVFLVTSGFCLFLYTISVQRRAYFILNLHKNTMVLSQSQGVPHGDARQDHEMMQGVARQLTVFALDDTSDDSDLNDTLASRAQLSPTMIVTKGYNPQEAPNICLCEFISIDCLDSIDCLPRTRQASQQIMAMGVYTRQVIKDTSSYFGRAPPMAKFPIGLSTQQTTIQSWMHWTQNQRLPHDFDSVETIFLNSTWYPECESQNWIGKNCFFAPTPSPEDMDDFETQAVKEQPVSEVWRTVLQHDLEIYLQRKREKEPTYVPSLGDLLTAAHITRIRFNRRPMVQTMFHNLTRVYNPVISSTERAHVLRVSVHLRRADSCSSQTYETQASPLDSPSQPTSLRKCYATAVYMRALERIQKRLQKYPDSQRRIHVYLSSDDSGSLISEIQTSFPQVYNSITWHVLGFDRSAFDYLGSVEGQRHNNHATLGETAVADLWLLSHGEVFIGHLGSRFGKIGYMLATARYNRFVPFFTVDGHSYCCDVDEPCGYMKPYIRSMPSCLTFPHVRRPLQTNPDYWTIGTLTRKKAELDLEAKIYPQQESFFWPTENAAA